MKAILLKVKVSEGLMSGLRGEFFVQRRIFVPEKRLKICVYQKRFYAFYDDTEEEDVKIGEVDLPPDFIERAVKFIEDETALRDEAKLFLK